MSIKLKAQNAIRSGLTRLSPQLNTRVLYRSKKKRRVHLKQPRTFDEKLLWLKLNDYNRNPLVKQCADKYAVREYVKSKGWGSMLNALYGAYDSADSIPWDNLPRQFALKLNVGCGCNYICADKAKANRQAVLEEAQKWLKSNHWAGYAELQYKDVPKKLLVEKYLSNADGKAPEDYKIYCFHGQPTAVLYMDGRFTDEMHVGFFDTSWRHLGIRQNDKKKYRRFSENALPRKPVSLDKMLAAAAALSKEFPFVRVDFFEVNQAPVFGEMTFTPAAGFDAAEVDINGKSMAELLHISA